MKHQPTTLSWVSRHNLLLVWRDTVTSNASHYIKAILSFFSFRISYNYNHIIYCNFKKVIFRFPASAYTSFYFFFLPCNAEICKPEFLCIHLAKLRSESFQLLLVLWSPSSQLKQKRKMRAENLPLKITKEGELQRATAV